MTLHSVHERRLTTKTKYGYCTRYTRDLDPVDKCDTRQASRKVCFKVKISPFSPFVCIGKNVRS